MTNDDLKKISGLLDERFEESEKRILEEVGIRFEASEKRILGEVDKRFEESDKLTMDEIKASKHKVMTEIGNFISQNVLPLIDEKADKSDIDRLERKLDRVLDNVVEQDSRLRKIESVSVVAQELRLKKSNNSSDE